MLRVAWARVRIDFLAASIDTLPEHLRRSTT